MRKLHKILRMHFSGGASIREIAPATDVDYGTVANYLKAARQAGLTWPLLAQKTAASRAAQPECTVDALVT